jgi:hypothetical protein
MTWACNCSVHVLPLIGETIDERLLHALQVKGAGKSIDEERKWQDDQLPFEVKDLVLSAREIKNS